MLPTVTDKILVSMKHTKVSEEDDLLTMER